MSKITYSRNALLQQRRYGNFMLLNRKAVLDKLAACSILNYRGNRAGKQIKNQNQINSTPCHDQMVTPTSGSTTSTQATDNIKLCCQNVRSARNKSAAIGDFLSDGDYDFMALTETWHEPDDRVLLRSLAPDGYSSIGHARPVDPSSIKNAHFINHGCFNL